MKAMIFAAGLGTRLSPLTLDKPKALVEIGGKPLLRIVLEKLIQHGFKEVIVNVHHFADQVIEYLHQNKNFGIDIYISDEKDKLLDTGGGVKHAAWFFHDVNSFLIHNVDIISDLDLGAFYKFHEHSGALATLAVKERESSRYFLFNDKQQLCGWKNVHTGQEIISRIQEQLLKQLAYNGIMAMNTSAFSVFPEIEKFSIVDVLLKMASTEKIIGFPHHSPHWVDVGKLQNIPVAEEIYAKIKDK